MTTVNENIEFINAYRQLLEEQYRAEHKAATALMNAKEHAKTVTTSAGHSVAQKVSNARAKVDVKSKVQVLRSVKFRSPVTKSTPAPTPRVVAPTKRTNGSTKKNRK